MQKHVTVVGILFVAMGVLGIAGAAIVVAVTVSPGLLAYALEGTAEALVVLTTFGCAAGGCVALLSVPEIIAGVGLLQGRNWARYLALFLSVLNVFAVPLGTAVGIYSLWVLLQNETEALFERGRAAADAAVGEEAADVEHAAAAEEGTEG